MEEVREEEERKWQREQRKEPRARGTLIYKQRQEIVGWIYCAHISVTVGVMGIMGHNYPRLSRPTTRCSCNGALNHVVTETAGDKVLKTT
jgi:hypothetical protein